MAIRFNEKEFVVQFNLDYCLKRYSEIKTAESALLSNKIKVRELAKVYTEDAVLVWIESWIANLAAFKDISIEESQVKKTAMFILEEVYMLNLAELTLLFKRIMKGSIFYNKFDGTTIIHAARDYRQERGRILSKMSTEQYKELFEKR